MKTAIVLSLIPVLQHADFEADFRKLLWPKNPTCSDQYHKQEKEEGYFLIIIFLCFSTFQII